ncbi:MAG: SusE domain-containing protein [Flavobacteriaceae bacterium]
MKTRFITLFAKIVLPVALLFVAVGCENEDDDPQFTLTETSDAVAFSNTLLQTYYLSYETRTNIAERLLWNKPDFGAVTQVNYKVEVSTSQTFAADAVASFDSGTITDTTYAITVEQLWTAALALGLDDDPTTTDKGNTGTVYARVTASVGDPTNSNGTTKVSETISMSLTIVEKQPTNAANCDLDAYWAVGAGAFDAGWGWTSPVEIPCTGTNVYSGYIALRNIAGDNNNFRFFTEKDNWGSGVNYPTFVANGYTIDVKFAEKDDGDKNFAFVGSSATYHIEINAVAKTITLTQDGAEGCDYTNLYAVGAGVPDAGWGWTSPINLPCQGNGVYSSVMNLNNNGGADNNFRFFTEKDNWGSGVNYPSYVSDGYTVDAKFEDAQDGDNNFAFVGTTGLYRVDIDTVNKTIIVAEGK